MGLGVVYFFIILYISVSASCCQALIAADGPLPHPRPPWHRQDQDPGGDHQAGGQEREQGALLRREQHRGGQHV